MRLLTAGIITLLVLGIDLLVRLPSWVYGLLTIYCGAIVLYEIVRDAVKRAIREVDDVKKGNVKR